MQGVLRGVGSIYTTRYAFAALLKDDVNCTTENGNVVTWGDSRYGGDSNKVQVALRGVDKIYSTDHDFAAVLEDGTVVT